MHREIRNLCVVPVLLCILLLTIGMGLGVFFVDDAFLALNQDWVLNLNLFLKSLIYILSVLVYFILLYFIVFLAVSILAIPVCEKIAEKIFLLKTQRAEEKMNFLEKINLTLKMLLASLSKFLILLIVLLFIFIGSLIPVLYPLMMFLTFLIVTWDCMDYAFERSKMNFSSRVLFLKKYFAAFSGLSFCIGLLLFIPFIHFFLLPIAVMSSTCLFLNIRNQEGAL